MQLNDQQVAAFHRDGYLVIPELFTVDEVAVLRAEVPRIFSLKRALSCIFAEDVQFTLILFY